MKKIFSGNLELIKSYYKLEFRIYFILLKYHISDFTVNYLFVLKFLST